MGEREGRGGKGEGRREGERGGKGEGRGGGGRGGNGGRRRRGTEREEGRERLKGYLSVFIHWPKLCSSFQQQDHQSK